MIWMAEKLAVFEQDNVAKKHKQNMFELPLQIHPFCVEEKCNPASSADSTQCGLLNENHLAAIHPVVSEKDNSEDESKKLRNFKIQLKCGRAKQKKPLSSRYLHNVCI